MVGLGRLRHRVRAAAHTVADELLTRVVGGPKMYGGGFGSLDELAELVARVRDYDSSIPPTRVEMVWSRSWTTGNANVRSGTFQSPAAGILPLRTRTGHVELYEPRHGNTGRVCLLLAATGEEGYGLRRRLVGPLLREGIGALLLENPFYGSRRPEGQTLSLLRTVRDQFAMNCATVDETWALLRWLRDQGFVPGRPLDLIQLGEVLHLFDGGDMKAARADSLAELFAELDEMQQRRIGELDFRELIDAERARRLGTSSQRPRLRPRVRS